MNSRWLYKLVSDVRLNFDINMFRDEYFRHFKDSYLESFHWPATPACRQIKILCLIFLQYQRHQKLVGDYLRYYGGKPEHFKRDRFTILLIPQSTSLISFYFLQFTSLFRWTIFFSFSVTSLMVYNFHYLWWRRLHKTYFNSPINTESTLNTIAPSHYKLNVLSFPVQKTRQTTMCFERTTSKFNFPLEGLGTIFLVMDIDFQATKTSIFLRQYCIVWASFPFSLQVYLGRRRRNRGLVTNRLSLFPQISIKPEGLDISGLN